MMSYELEQNLLPGNLPRATDKVTPCPELLLDYDIESEKDTEDLLLGFMDTLVISGVFKENKPHEEYWDEANIHLPRELSNFIREGESNTKRRVRVTLRIRDYFDSRRVRIATEIEAETLALSYLKKKDEVRLSAYYIDSKKKASDLGDDKVGPILKGIIKAAKQIVGS